MIAINVSAAICQLSTCQFSSNKTNGNCRNCIVSEVFAWRAASVLLFNVKINIQRFLISQAVSNLQIPSIYGNCKQMNECHNTS